MRTEDEKSLQKGTKCEQRPGDEMHRSFKDVAGRVGPGADTVHGDGLWWPQARQAGSSEASSEGHSRQAGSGGVRGVPTDSKHDKWLLTPCCSSELR